MNLAGLAVVVLGLALIIIGFRGTQSQVLPWFFGGDTKPSGNSGGQPPPPTNQGFSCKKASDCGPDFACIAGTCQPINIA